MASELTLSALLSFAKDRISFITNPQSIRVTVAGQLALKNVQSISTSDETLDLGGIGTIGFVLFRNLELKVDMLTPTAPVITHVGTAGSSTWTYKIVALDSNGSFTAASAGGSTTTGNATLDVDNYNILTWDAVTEAASYDIYRTAVGTTPSTTGLIGNVTALTFNDQGAAGDASTAPSTSSDRILKIGSDGTLYPNSLKGGEFALVRWNAAAIHAKATAAGDVLLEYTIVED